MRHQHLVIFAKAPRLGGVKSRLARGIGRLAALAFYRRTLATLLRRLAGDPRWRTTLAVTPDRAAHGGALWRRLGARAKLPRKAQGPGDLGQRMGRAFRDMPHGPVVIIGADIPEISARQVARAFQALGACDVVLGPAPDGGYWLVGLRRGPKLRDLFAAVRWSSPTARSDTLNNACKPGRAPWGIRLLESLDDIDDIESYRRWRRSGGG